MKLHVISLFTFIAFAFLSTAQINHEAFIPLQSSGEIPLSLREDCQFMLFDNTQNPYLTTGKTTTEEIQLVYKSLTSTGKVIFGDTTHYHCTEILKQLIKIDPEIQSTFEIYPFKSSYPCALNDGKSTIYISTALIARTTKLEHLYFLIARQLFLLKTKAQPEYMKLNRNSDFIDRLKTLGIYSGEIQRKADLYGLNSVTLLKMDGRQAIQGLNIFIQPDSPMEELEVSTKYFTSDLFHFPEMLFDISTYRFEKPNFDTEQLSLIERKKELTKSELLSRPVDSIDLLKKDFVFFHDICALQYIQDLLITNEPEKALYHIFLVENRVNAKDYLDKMKAHAWLTLIRKTVNPTSGRPTTKSVIQNSHSGSFLIALRRLNIPATESLGLRIVTDLMKKNDDPELPMIRNYMIDFIQKSNNFVVDSFSTKTYQEVEKLPLEDIRPFYIYGISDLVQDTIFKNQIQGKTPVYLSSNSYNSLLVVDPIAYSFHKQKFKSEKTKEKSAILEKSIELEAIDSNLDIQFYRSDTSMMKKWVEFYNIRGCYNQLNLQLINQTQNKTAVFPVNIGQFNQFSTVHHSEILGLFHFENQYNLNPKGYHFTGLLLIPLPFVATDLFLGGNHCQFISYVIDTKTGKLVYFENSKYRDPLTKPFIKNKIQFSFKSI